MRNHLVKRERANMESQAGGWTGSPKKDDRVRSLPMAARRRAGQAAI